MSDIEVQIQKLLKDSDPIFVADQLLKKWEKKEYSMKDLETVSDFLIHAGLHETLINQLKKQLTNGDPFLWVPFFKILYLYQENLTDEVAEAIIEGLKQSGSLDLLAYAQPLSKLNKKIKNTYEEQRKEKISELSNKIKIKEENELLDLLNKERTSTSFKTQNEDEASSDKGSSEEIIELALEKAKKLLLKKERLKIDFESEKAKTFSQEEKILINNILKKSKKNKDLAYDLSILLAQMEAYDKALECLSHAPESKEKDWYRLELLILTKRYLDALNESYILEKKYADQPEVLWASLELRAKALYGLNEKEKAIQILELLAQTTPKNQVIKSLLEKWRSDS